MKFFSRATFKEIITGFHEGIKNYPLSLFFSFLTSCLAYSTFSKTNFLFIFDHKSAVVEKLFVVFTLCIPWSFGLTVRFQKFVDKSTLKFQDLASSLITLVLILYLGYLHRNVSQTAESYHLALGFIATHMYVACAFFPRDEKHTFYFWHSNILVFHRFLFAYIVAGITCAGILGLAHVFSFLIYNLHLKDKFHAFVFCASCIFIHTWVFVSGCKFENSFSTDEEDFKAYKYLKNLLQYVSIPLISLYIAVLTLYLLKILFTWNLPKGQVSYFVTSLAGFGILFFLLSRRFATESSSPIFQLYRKYFFIAFVPLLTLLWIAVLRRFIDYGISPDRYLLLVLTLWLTVITGAFILKPERSLGIIPFSLFVVSLTLVLTPFSVDRLPVYLMLNNAKAKLAEAQAGTNSKLSQHLSSTVVELLVMKGQNWVAEQFNLSNSFRRDEVAVNWRFNYTERNKILAELKLPEIKFMNRLNDTRYVYCNSYDMPREMNAKNVEHIVLNLVLRASGNNAEQKIGADVLKSVHLKNDKVVFSFQNNLGIPQAEIDMKEIQEKLLACEEKKSNGFELVFKSGRQTLKFYATSANAILEDEKFKLSQLNGDLLIYAQ